MLEPTLNAIAFGVLALSIVAGAVFLMGSRNVVHAAYWLLECSVATAAMIWFLGAEYVALVQLLVYAGAVGVLVIFTIMITLRSREDAERPIDFNPVALVAALAFFGFMAYAITNTTLEHTAALPVAIPELADFGAQMFSIDGWAYAFELASLILTVALVAGVWWTRDGDN